MPGFCPGDFPCNLTVLSAWGVRRGENSGILDCFTSPLRGSNLGRNRPFDPHHRIPLKSLYRMHLCSSSKTDAAPRLVPGTCVPGIFRVTLAFFRPGGKQCNLTLFRLGPGAKQCNLTLFRPPLLPIVQKKSARSSTVSHWADNFCVSAFWNGKSSFLKFWRNPAKMKDLSLETTIFGILAHFCTRCTGFRLIRTMWGRDRAPSV